MDNIIEEKSKNKSFLYRQKIPLAVKLVMDFFFILCVITLLTVTIFFIIYIKTPVTGPSMMPTINAEYNESNKIEDYVYINRFSSVNRGDIIVIHKILQDDKYVIKRLIAKGGDYLKITKNELTGEIELYLKYSINEDPILLEEPYLYSKEGNKKTYECFNLLSLNENLTFTEDGYLYIEPGYVFYLGDNRGQSEDCSNYGPIKSDLILGKVDIIQKYNENAIPIIYDFFFY